MRLFEEKCDFLKKNETFGTNTHSEEMSDYLKKYLIF